MSTYRAQNNVPPFIPLSQYLLHRLKQLGVTTIFGLPGEHNAPLINQIYQIPSMTWCGNTNELNASYAADGYARIKRLSCLITTFGVGEMSVLNGVAGAFAEHVPILHIVGMPPSSAQLKQLLLNHTLGKTDYDVFHRLASDICCYSAVIKDAETAMAIIEKCIGMCYSKQRPVYCGIPVNFINAMTSSHLLDIPLEVDNFVDDPSVDNLVELTLEKLYAAKHPLIMADGCAIRHDCLSELRQLATVTGFPLCATPMGKTAFDEQDRRYAGVYTGTISSPQVREVVDFSDFILVVGAMAIDFATSSFHFYYKTKNIIFLFDTFAKVTIGSKMYPDLRLKYVMQTLVCRLDRSRINYIHEAIPESIQFRVLPDPNTPLRQEWLWARMAQWFQEGDVIITETGTSGLGINQIKLPSNAKIISQPLWGSVGFSVGACLGVLIAVREEIMNGCRQPGSRTILFVGDGALQLTAQELSTIIRFHLTPFIFVVNNKGNSVDRLLNRKKLGTSPNYYDLQQWDNLALIPTFGATEYDTTRVSKVGQLDQLLNDLNFAQNSILKMVEILLPSMDGPQVLMDIIPESI
ncbi:HFL106Cp [Eremothecium sinecaudum]|uniref:HFL106Cp n=1 Tax=Eremothecium sinecaudum TaxID=45286 RepID=A0A109UZP7_9SACH|nr:HFL106Cp [Eremothecium sinecaudum]AMD21750.1 HFL106Cp [Eremothecium sinecaudum]